MRRSFPVFLIIVLIVLAVAYAYVSARLGETFWSKALLALPFFAIALYPLTITLLPRHRPSAARAFLQWAGYFGMASVSFLLPLVMLRDLLVLPFVYFGGASLAPQALKLFGPSANLVIVVGAALMLATGLRRAIQGPRVRELDIEFENLPEALEGFKIAQISDLHVGPTIGRDYVEAVVTRTLAMNPDLVALTGDIADGLVDSLHSAIEPLARLKPQGRVFFVMGNHEYYWQGGAWIEKMRALGATPLLNSNEIIEFKGTKLLIGGVVDPAASLLSPGAKPDVKSAAETSEEVALKILLAHHPNAADKAEKAGFDLQLSGHTHGGQFFPWTLVVRHVHRFHVGLFTHGKLKIYVNPGTGYWGPPVRLGTHPEITLFHLKRTRSLE